MYVHHDVPLPSFPLCLAHGDIGPTGNAGNFCAVGTFSPGIEIWNLDVLNALEPSCVLGGEDTSIADDIMKMQLMGRRRPVDLVTERHRFDKAATPMQSWRCHGTRYTAK